MKIIFLLFSFTLLTCLPSISQNIQNGNSENSATSALTLDPNPDPRSINRLVREGSDLTPSQVAEMEALVKNNPEHLGARAKLLGYYYSKYKDLNVIEETKSLRLGHILWLIAHHPESELLGTAEASIDSAGHSLADPLGYSKAKELWMDQVKKEKSNTRILYMAALYYRICDKPWAIHLLNQILTINPQEPGVSGMLGYTYGTLILGVNMITKNGLPAAVDPAQASSEQAKRAVSELRASTNIGVIAAAGRILYQYGSMLNSMKKNVILQNDLAEELLIKCTQLAPNEPAHFEGLMQFYSNQSLTLKTPEERHELTNKALKQAILAVNLMREQKKINPYYLNSASKLSAEAGAYEKAADYAKELLTMVTDNPTKENCNFFHDSHMVLGRVAIHAGDAEQAKIHLLQSTKTNGVKWASYFGPNMSLARELAEKGEYETVITYLESCRPIWNDGQQLSQWISTLKEKKVPNFGGNLIN